MSRLSIALGCVCLVAAVVLSVGQAPDFSDDDCTLLFTKFMKQYDKVYSEDEIPTRMAIFKTNLQFIAEHNSVPRSYKLAMNQFGDMSVEEYSALLGFKDLDHNKLARFTSATLVNATDDQLPDSVDWRQHGVVTKIANQGQCGSCWAFAATESVESAVAIATGTLYELSTQELVDCSGSFGNMGCNGGEPDNAFKFIVKNGLCAAADYPYNGTTGTCEMSKCQAVAHVRSFADVPPNNEDALKAAVAKQPVAAALEADKQVFMFYSSGILDGDCGTQVNHGVVVVGYGSEDGKDFWIVRNMWGTSWGEQGYARLARGSGSGSPGECGIATVPSYPIV